jgi:hypothetical protein
MNPLLARCVIYCDVAVWSQAGLAIADRLAKSNPGNASWQRDLSVSYYKIGDVQVAQGLRN